MSAMRLIFNVPTHSEDYVHRIGRTGRAGRDGMAITLATSDDVRLVAGIEKLIAKPILVLYRLLTFRHYRLPSVRLPDRIKPGNTVC